MTSQQSSVLIVKKRERNLMMPNHFRAFRIFPLIWEAKENFESSIKPYCLGLFIVFMSIPIKYTSG